MRLTMGIDIGTYASKGVIVDENGRIMAQAARLHEMLVPRPGFAEHRPEEDWWGDTAHIARELVAGIDGGALAIEALAVSAIGPCMLPVDQRGTPLMNGVLYGVDTRAAAEVEQLAGSIGTDALLHRCGNVLSSQSVGPKILWLRQKHPDIFARTATIHTSTSFIVARLTGRSVIDHFTAINFAPLYDAGSMTWCSDLAGDIAPPTMLPSLHWSNEVAGRVTPDAARATGLLAGTPVTTGTIDAAAEAISVGVRRPDDMMIMYGSTMFLVQLVQSPVSDARIYRAPWLFPGLHAVQAGQATSGTLTHWFRERFARELPRDKAFQLLAAEAAAASPSGRNLILLPYFSGERSPINDARARGVIFGLDLTHTRGDIYRALIEGIAMGTAHIVETMQELNVRPERVFAVGGGTENPLWLQAVSDFCEFDQRIRAHSIGASYGDAFLAACAAGITQCEDIERWNPETRLISSASTRGHRRHFARYKALYRRTRTLAHALAH